MNARQRSITFPEICEGFEDLPPEVRKFFRLYGLAITDVRESVERLEESSARTQGSLDRIEGAARKVVWGLLATVGTAALAVAAELLRAVH